MANNPHEYPADDFLEQILGLPNFQPTDTGLPGNAATDGQPMLLQLSSGGGTGHVGSIGGGALHGQVFSLGLTLEQGKGGFLKPEEASGSGKRFCDEAVDGRASSVKNVFHGQPIPATAAAPHPPAMRPRVRARRGQATDPHNIAERIDRAAMLDEIVDYMKFLRLQVKVLSMSRLGAAGAVAPLVTDIPLSSVEDESVEGGRNQPAWEKWSMTAQSDK